MRSIILSEIKKIISNIEPNYFENKTILLTGSAGLIGFWILSVLDIISENINMTIYAQYHSQIPSFSNYIFQNKNIHFIQIDLANFSEYSKIPNSDVIIHTAGYAQPMKFLENDIDTLQINVSGTIALLKCLNKNGKFLFLSSAEVYSGLNQKPFNEKMIGTTNTLNDRSSYIEGKRGGEAACYMMYKKGYDAKSIRLGDTYGPGNRINDKRAIYDFIRNGLNNKKIDLLDSGLAIRNYCYISDVIELLFKILLLGKNPIYNLAGKEPIYISDVANIIGKVLNVPVNIPTNSLNGILGAPKDLAVDTTLINSEFNKKDYISLEDGLIKTITWQKKL